MEQDFIFTNEEIELLQTALSALTDRKETLSDVFGDMTSVFAKGFENFSKHSEWQGTDTSQNRKEKRQQSKDDILLLQAKLVQLKRNQQQRSAATSSKSDVV